MMSADESPAFGIHAVYRSLNKRNKNEKGVDNFYGIEFDEFGGK